MEEEHQIRHASVIKIDGKIVVPHGAKASVIVPDEVVEWCANKYGLAKSGTWTIDPMCGVGTIPRVISRLGGQCTAIELDKSMYEIAKTVLPENVDIINGDCTKVKIPRVYDAAYVSLPFEWFNKNSQVNPAYAQTLKRMLRPGGLLLIDTDDVTTRRGRSWPVAARQIAYLTANGFRFEKSHKFVVQSGQPGSDTTFVELLFKATK